jgi:AraC-like DNA-binding protein
MDIKNENISDFHIDILKIANSYDMPFFHYHNCYEIYVIIKGGRKVILQDSIYEGREGDVFLLPPNYIHRTGGNNCVRFVINFSDIFLKEYFTRATTDALLKCFEVPVISLNSKTYEKAVQLCNRLLENRNENKERIAIWLAELLLTLGEHVDYDVQKQFSVDSVKLVSDILEHINGNYRNINNITEVSEIFHISKHYLCRVFKRHTGTTVMSYVNSLKVDAARNQIIGTRKKLGEIAKECGFVSANYLSKAFRKSYGISPEAYRKENREKDVNVGQ